jgi:hypothetical protein
MMVALLIILVLFEKANQNSLYYKNKLKTNEEILVFFNQVAICSKDNLYTYDINFLFSDFDLIEKNNFVYLIFSNQENAHLLTFDKKNTLFSYFYCDKLTLNQDKIVLATKNNDYAKTLTMIEIDTDTNATKQFIAKTTSSNKQCTNKNIIPYVFMQAIKIKEFDYARQYLSQLFSESLLDEHLEQFFGNFSKATVPKIKLPPFSLTLVYNTPPLFQTRHFTFSFNQDKIDNIDESE